MRAVLAFAALATLLTSAPARAQSAYGAGDEGYVDGDYGADEAGVAYDPAGYSVGYYGPHPVPYDQVTGQGGGFCYTEGPHTHDYVPFDEHLFREYNGYYYFIGDPVDFGWNRSIYWYQANHPIPVGYGGGYCYITWPHRHGYEPVGLGGFTLLNGYWIFTGTWPTDYWYYRNYYWGYYQRYYRTWYYGNRYYRVRPRPVYVVSRPYRVPAPPGRVFVSAPPPARRWGTPTAPPVNRVPPPPGSAHGHGVPGRPYPYYQTPPPAYGTPNRPSAPAYQAPPPAYGTPSQPSAPVVPAYQAPPPVYRPSAPTYQAPPPAYQAPAPVYRPSAPAYQAPPPVYRAPAPSAPVYRAPAPAPVFRGGGGGVGAPPPFRR